jgi:hypothetical protein
LSCRYPELHIADDPNKSSNSLVPGADSRRG